MNRSPSELGGLVSELTAATTEQRSLAAQQAGRRDPERYRAACARLQDAHRLLVEWIAEIEDALAAGDSSAVAPALHYLEADPYYFGSGYAREHLARTLARTRLDEQARARARTYVLRCIDGELHCKEPGRNVLARAVANNEFRRAVRSRLHSDDAAVAIRAARALTFVTHPGLTPADVERMRTLFLRHRPPHGIFALSRRNNLRLARLLWSPEWESELRELARHHGPEREAAKHLLRYVDWRRKGRETGRAGP